MTENNLWSFKDNQLIATLLIPDLSKMQRILARYRWLLQQWQILEHPAIFKIDDSQVNFKELDSLLEAKIFVNQLNKFKPANLLIPSLSSFEKLFIFQQTLDIDISIRAAIKHRENKFTHDQQYHSLNVFNPPWEMSRLYLHQSGICGWLPPVPSCNDASCNDVGNQGIIDFFFELFELKVDASVHDLNHSGNLPWEWNAFFEYYRSVPVDMSSVFPYVFYQSWLYTTANRLGMKDKVLNQSDYDILYQFGLNLGLVDAQIQRLNIIAQQQEPDWKDLIKIRRQA